MQIEVTCGDAPANLEETGTRLRVRGGNRHTDDSLAAGDLEYTEVLAVMVRPFIAVSVSVRRIIVVGVILEIGIDTGMGAQESQVHLISDFDRPCVLNWNVAGAHEATTGDEQYVYVNTLPSHSLLGGFGFPAAIALNCGLCVGAYFSVVIPVRAIRSEGLTDLRGAFELDGADVVHGHARFGHAEEAGDTLAEVVGHLHVHGVDARRGHGELKGTGLCVILPHTKVGRVLDAVDRHAVNGASGQILKRLIVGREGDLGGRGGDGEGDLALAGHIAAHVGSGTVEVKGDLSSLIGRGVDKLDTGGLDDGLSLIVLLRIGLRYVHEAGGLIHDEALAHLRVGVVLGSEPFGQLRAGNVSTSPADIVFGILIDLEEHGMGHGLREHSLPMVGHSVAIIIRPERVKRALGKSVTVDDRGGHGEHVRTGQLIALADVLGIRMVADVALDAGDGLALIDIHGFERSGTDRAVLIESRGDDGVSLDREGGLAVLDIDGGAVLLTLEYGDAVGEVPLIRSDVHRDIGAYLDGQRHVLGAVEGELAVLGLGERDGRKLRLGCVSRDGRERIEHGAGDEHG